MYLFNTVEKSQESRKYTGRNLYDRMKKEVPNFRKKVVTIVGNLDFEDRGVSIIFHLAANVRFQEKIKSQIQTNIYATDTILRIAKLMPNLKSFIYVSTIYAIFCMKHIEEHVYTYPINYKDLITLTHILSENIMEEKTAKCILIKKLLRNCPDISTMYLLIRSKKKQESRKSTGRNLYDRMKKEIPNFRKKVVTIVGNLDFEDRVSIIFHLAANVRFQEKIKSQIQTNIYATDTILCIAKLMPNLKSFIYVSTIYANFCMKHIEEHVYTYPINYKDLITHILSENIMEEKTAKKLNNHFGRFTLQWPNTYTFTKAIAEGLLRDKSGPIGIFQPATITSTANEPLVGWNNNFLGEIGITERQRLIYNFVPSADAPTIGEWFYKIADIKKTYPLPKAQWWPFVIILQRKILYRICTWLSHLLPALPVDIISICMNHCPRRGKYMLIYNFVPSADAPTIGEWFYKIADIRKTYPLPKAQW
ncbi:hypothetical protein DBV15_11842, partial [Temnothorax longispinosus]